MERIEVMIYLSIYNKSRCFVAPAPRKFCSTAEYGHWLACIDDHDQEIENQGKSEI
jgi:hypothetical protein